MKKRMLALLLALSVTLGLLAGCRQEDASSGGPESAPAQEEPAAADAPEPSVTRAQWIVLLGQTFGLDSYQAEEPYYEDVAAGEESYAYVQSAREWGVLPEGETQFRPGDLVTRGETALMAVRAAGWDSLGGGAEDTDEAVLAFAREKGLLAEGDDLEGPMTEPECRAILSLAQVLYLGIPVEEKAEVSLTENVADYSAASPGTVTVEGTTVTLSQPDETLQAGSVIITPPTAEAPAGVARKITSITAGPDGGMILETEEPELSDVLENLDASFTVAPSADMFTAGPGFTLTTGQASSTAPAAVEPMALRAGAEPQVEDMWNMDKQFDADPLHFEADFGSGSFEKNYTNKKNEALGGGEGAQALEKSNFVYDKTPSVEDFKGSTEGWTEKLEVQNSFSGGYQITGSVDVQNIYVAVKAKYEWFELKNFSVEVNADVVSTLQVTGELHERLTVGRAAIPTPVPGLTVDLELQLYADANGELQLEWTLSNNTKVEYSGGNLRKTCNADSQTTFQLAIELGLGADASVGVSVFGIGIVDVNASVGADLTAAAQVQGTVEAQASDEGASLTYREAMTLEADLYYPIVSLGVGNGDNLANKLGLSGSWDLITRDNAKHMDLLDYEWVFWEETVETDGSASSSPASSEGEQTEEEGNALSQEFTLQEAYVVLSGGESRKLTVLSLPEGVTEDQLTYESKNTAVATVSSDGTITAVGEGSALIYAWTPGGGLQVCAVTVIGEQENDWVFL